MPEHQTQDLHSLVAAQFESEPPRLLHHYTSLTAFISICSGGKLWASESRYMNDAQEMRFFAEWFDHALEKLGSVGVEAEINRQLRDWAKNRLLGQGHSVYVVSLSEEASLLSQWRAYTAVSQGLSIGFDAHALLAAARRQGFRLGKCVYSKDDTFAVCKRVATHLVKHALDRGAAGPSAAHPSQSYHPAFFELEDELVQLAALFKHFAFAEEKEWRLVSPILPNYVEAPLKYRPGATSIIPYLEFDLEHKADQRPNGGGAIAQAVVGPCVDSNRSMSSVRQVLSRSRFTVGSTSVINCLIPLRAV